MSKKIIQWITLISIIVIIAIGLKIFVINEFINNTKEQISKIAQLEKANKDMELTWVSPDSMSIITTFNTTHYKNLEKELKNLTSNYRKLADSLKNNITSVYTAEGNISLQDTLYLPYVNEPLDSVKTDWFTLEYHNVIERYIYNLTMKIVLEGVELSDPYGNRQVIENVYIQSTTNPDARKPVEWKANYTFFKPTTKLWHWWNPKIHSGILIVKPVQYGISTSLMSFGVNKYIETTTLYFLDIGIASDFQDRITFTGIPVLINMGQFLPFVSNANAGIGVGWELTSQKPVLIIKLSAVF